MFKKRESQKYHIDVEVSNDDSLANVTLYTDEKVITRFNAVLALFVSPTGEYIVSNRNERFTHGQFTDKNLLMEIVSNLESYDESEEQ